MIVCTTHIRQIDAHNRTVFLLFTDAV